MLICTEENEYMNDFLIIDDEDMNFIWNTIQQLQVVFHPQIAPCGKIDMERFFEIKRNKSIVLFVDRNILSGLLNFCENGSLKDRGESQILKEQIQETLIVLFEGAKIRHGIYVIYQAGVHYILTAKMFRKNLCLRQMTIS